MVNKKSHSVVHLHCLHGQEISSLGVVYLIVDRV